MTTTPEKPTRADPTWSDALAFPLGTLGAFVGAAIGALICKWGHHSGFYVIPLVGMLAGWGAALFAPRGGWLIGIIAGLIAAAVQLWTEWKFVGAFKADDSFAYFVTHFHQLDPFKLLLHALGLALAVWFGARK